MMGKTRRALLVWEIGGGRGHLALLILAARALRRIGFECTSALLAHHENAHEIAPLVGRVGPVPPMFYSMNAGKTRVPSESFADWLEAHGLFSGDVVLRRVSEWLRIFDDERPDIVIGDQSPYAMLAARTAGIACAATGVGYILPPDDLPHFLPYLPGFEADLSREAQMVDAINCALAGLGSLKIARLPEVYRCDAPIVCTNSLFDPYVGVRSVPLCPPQVAPVTVPETPGDEAFVYLSTTDRADPLVLTAVMTLPAIPRRLFVPSLDPAIASMMRERGVIVEKAPVAPADIVRRSRLALHAANHGISSLCLRGGVPMVCMPLQTEQFFNAQQIAQEGAGKSLSRPERTVGAIQRAIMDVYERSSYRKAAIAIGEACATEFQQSPEEAIVERVGALFH